MTDFDLVDVSANLPSGSVLSYGPATLTELGAGQTVTQGHAGLGALTAPAAKWYALTPSPNVGATVAGLAGRDVKTRYKGRVHVFSNDAASPGAELFAVGLCLTNLNPVTRFGSVDIGQRDDIGTIAAVVKQNLDLHGYNCSGGGVQDAAYGTKLGALAIDDTGATGFPWTLEVTQPWAPGGMCDLLVDLSVDDVSVYSAAAPLCMTNGLNVIPCVLMNLGGLLENVVVEVQKL